MSFTLNPNCTCRVRPAGLDPHEPDCPITPLRDAAIESAAEVLARITPRRKAADR